MATKIQDELMRDEIPLLTNEQVDGGRDDSVHEGSFYLISDIFMSHDRDDAMTAHTVNKVVLYQPTKSR